MPSQKTDALMNKLQKTRELKGLEPVQDLRRLRKNYNKIKNVCSQEENCPLLMDVELLPLFGRRAKG